MEMLPTIASLDCKLPLAILTDGNISLAENRVDVGELAISGIDARYLTPSAKYLAEHPADTLPDRQKPTPHHQLPGQSTPDASEVGLRYHCHVRYAEKLFAAGHLYNRHVAQSAFGRKKAGFLIEDATHVFVGGDKAFHEHVGAAGGDKRHCELHTTHIAFLIDNGKCRRIKIVFTAQSQYFGLVAEHCWLYETFAPCLIYSSESVGIVAVGNCQTLRPRLRASSINCSSRVIIWFYRL